MSSSEAILTGIKDWMGPHYIHEIQQRTLKANCPLPLGEGTEVQTNV